MAPGRSMDDPRPEDIVDLLGVQVTGLHFDQPFIPHFTVELDDKIYRIRVRYDNAELMKWVSDHQHQPLDLTIFLYKWEVQGASGTVNYLRKASVHIATPQGDS